MLGEVTTLGVEIDCARDNTIPQRSIYNFWSSKCLSHFTADRLFFYIFNFNGKC